MSMRVTPQRYFKDMREGYVKGSLTSPTKDVVEKELNRDFPLALNIESTNDCNLNCYICPRGFSKRKIGYMDFGLFKRIIDEIREYKRLKILTLHKDGESTLHPLLLDMIHYAKEREVASLIHINTNAVLLNKRYTERLIDSGIDDITISLDAFKRGTYKRIKGKEHFNLVETNIIEFFKLRKERALDKPFMRIKIIGFKDTQDEIGPFIQRWKDIADDVQVSALHTWGGAIKNIRSTCKSPRERYPCILLWYMMAVNWDGVVSMCNIDWDLSGKIGDVKTDSLHNIWNGERLKQIRRHHIQGDYSFLDVCMSCQVWTEAEDMRGGLVARKEFYE